MNIVRPRAPILRPPLGTRSAVMGRFAGSLVLLIILGSHDTDGFGPRPRMAPARGLGARPPRHGRTTTKACATPGGEVDDEARRALLRALGLAFLGSTASIGPAGVPSAAAAAAVASGIGAKVYRDMINQSPSDPRRYRALRLDNGLEVTLVQDRDADTAAAALDVHVGHFSDPTEPPLPGLAHFTEHSVFLGTEKYPQEDGFAAFLSTYGGSCNAFTAAEDTCYYFDLGFPRERGTKVGKGGDGVFLGEGGALDRFASFFTGPLFTESATAREVNAVDAEHRKNLQQDFWRVSQLEAATANPEHPLSGFGTGNIDTLLRGSGGAEALREALLRFWRRYYIAPFMTLCVVSNCDLDVVQDCVTKAFGAIPIFPRDDYDRPMASLEDVSQEGFRRGYALPPPEAAWKGIVPPYLPVPAPLKLMLVKTVGPLRTLKVAFHAERPQDLATDVRGLLAKAPLVISNLIGHEGETSLLAALKREGLVTGLSSGVGAEASDTEDLSIQVDLTEKGMAEWETVIILIFGFVEKLRRDLSSESGAFDYVMDECSDLAEISWRFSDRGEPSSYASSLAQNMHTLRGSSPTRYLDGLRRFLVVDPRLSQGVRVAKAADLKPLVLEYLEKLSPLNARLSLLSQALSEAKELQVRASSSPPRVAGSPSFSSSFTFPALGLRERWYGTPYAYVDASGVARACLRPSDLVSRVEGAGIAIPAPNPYIPRKLDLKAPQLSPGSKLAEQERRSGPACLFQDDTWRVYYKRDVVFGQPKAFVSVQISNPRVCESARSVILSKLWRMAVIDDLASDTYDAALAGLGYDLDVNARGVRLGVFGYDERLNDFLFTVVSRVRGLALGSEGAFGRIKELLGRELEAFDTQQPYQHAKYWDSLLTERPQFSREALRGALEEVTVEALRTHALRLWGDGAECFGDALIEGNLTPEDAEGLARTLRAGLAWEGGTTPDRSRRSTKRYAVLPVAKPGMYPSILRPNFDPGNTNGALEVVFQFPGTSLSFAGPGEDSLERRVAEDEGAAVQVLAGLLDEPFFEELRTRQQLGYIVFGGARVTADGLCSLVFIVQSFEFPPNVLLERVHGFLGGLGDLIRATPSGRITGIAASLADKKLQRDKRLAQQVVRHWEEVTAGTLEWDRREREVEALNRVTKQAVLELYESQVAPGSSGRRVMAFQMYDGSKGEEGKPGPAMARSGGSGTESAISISEEVVDFGALRAELEVLPARGCSV